MPRIETSQLASWLDDKADRAPELSWGRMMHAAADRLRELDRPGDQQYVVDFGWARGDGHLKALLESLSIRGFEVVCVTHIDSGCYRVFYRRPSV